MLQRSFTNCLDLEAGYIGIEHRLNSVEHSAGNDNPEDNWYIYHSDHLGSSSFLSDANGDPTQHLQYLPFGENYIEQRATTDYYTPYTFSAKERDPETGYSYFGARYYDPNVSIWLSVDPMSDERSWISAFSYCQNNPINRIDPNGELDWKPDESGNLIADQNDDALTLSKYLEISFEKASKIFNNLGNWDGGTNTDGIENVNGHKLTISDKSLKIGNIAEYYANIGSTGWNYEVSRGNYPSNTNKCNIFVYDVARKAGASPGQPNVINPRSSRLPFIRRKFGPPFAGQWADPSFQIANWRVLSPNETPKRGDVAAYQFPFADASGHVAIVVSGGATIGTSATQGRIAKSRFGFDSTLSHGQPITYRRYVGN